MDLKKMEGPACPRCGCQDASQAEQVVRWGHPARRLQCRHCGLTWTVRDEATEEPDVTAGVEYHLVECPACGGDDCPVRSTQRPVRWHKCRTCGTTFKSVEKPRS